MKGEDSSGANQQCQLAQNCNRIRQPHQNKTAYRGIERFTCGDLGNIGLDKAHIVQAYRCHASPRLARERGSRSIPTTFPE